ncbi:phage tail protein [Salmonella enterica subsp. arizonae]|nr:phage tail protein [Salmonella enterica subsp. arizonae]
MHLPNGTQIFVENKRDAEKNATDVTNAKEPVFTITDNGFAKNDYVIVTSSDWGKLVNRVLRVKSVEQGNVTMEGIDTSDTNVFPEGEIKATVAKITGWSEIPCVQDLAQDGGEQQYYNYQCLSDDQEQQLPTFKSAVSLTYTFAHEYDNAIYPLLRDADETGAITALRMYIPKAQEMRLWSGVLSFNEIPKTAVNEMETVSLSVSLKGKFTFLSSVPNA